MKQKIYDELIRHKYYLLVSSLISILTILPNMVLAFSEIKLYVLSVILLILISKINQVIFLFISIYINVVNILIIHIALHWGYYYPDINSRLYAMSLSPKYEMIEYLKNYLDYRDVLIFLYMGIVFILMSLFFKKITNSFKILKLFALFILLPVLVYLFNTGRLNREPFSIVKKVIEVTYAKDYIEKRRLYLQQLNNKKDKIDQKLLYDKVIVIIGESVNKHHMNIYDYNINTTPFLSNLKKNSKVYIFNAIAPANQTSYAVPILLTKANVHNFQDTFIHSTSIVTDFSHNGYNTSWISNQGHSGKFDSVISEIANESDKQMFFNSDYLSAKSDQVVVDYLKSKKITRDKEFVVVHLIGSHFDYSKRYIQNHSIYNAPKNIVEHYDNSIYFTDYVLSEIYQYYFKKDEKVLLVYFSDHGEILSSQKHGHGFNPPSKDEYDVPFVICSSIDNKRIEELKQLNKQHFFNNENMNYIIKYISGLTDELNISFSSNVFTLDPKYIINYDKLEYYKTQSFIK